MKKTKLKTIVNLILDESGSMLDIKDSTISAINEYVKSLRKQKGLFYFTLTTFNSDGIKTPYLNVPIIDVKPLGDKDYAPTSLTPLYDAVGETVIKVENQLKDSKEKTAVLVVIVTDGFENYSKEFNQTRIHNLIERLKKEKDWTFVFLGANQDSWAVGQSLGISLNNNLNWNATSRGVQMMAVNLAQSTANYSDAVVDSVLKGASLRVDNFFDNTNKENA